MKKIVPGGYYSYDAAGKKIWLDYSYYGVGLENIDRIRNLSKNLDLYSSSGAGKPITVENGCITHSYQGTEADTDKIQVTLRTPITNSLTELEAVDGVVTLETDGKVLVLPTGHPYLLPKYNEFTLTEGRALPAAGTYTFTNDYDSELGILNLNKNWIALYNSASNIINFFLFTHKPKKLQYVVSDIVSHVNFQTADGEIFTTSDGNDFLVMRLDAYITSLILYPGNGLIYHGQITFSDLTRDSNSDLIPDFLDSSVLGSLSKFLQSYATVDGTPGAKQFLTADGKEFLTADGKYLFVRA